MVDKEAYDVHKLNKKLLVKTLVFVLVLVIGMIGTFSAYAMNFDYLEPSKWDNSRNITSVEVTKTSTDRELKGVMKYCIDEKEGCLYVAFFVTETSLYTSRDDVRIRFNISGDHRSEFAVCKEGIVDCEKEPDFPVYQNFLVYEDDEIRGRFIAALDFGKVKYDTSVNISVCANGRYYNNVHTIIVPPTKANITKSAKATAQRTSKDKTVVLGEKSSKVSTERSTKFQASGTVSARANQSRGSGKSYSYSYSKSTDSETGVHKEGVTTAPSREEQLENEHSEGYSVRGRLTQHSKNIILVALIIAFIGLCFLIASAFMEPEKKTDEKDSDDSTDNKTQTDEE